MRLEELTNLNEQIAYLNGVLHVVGTLNTTSGNIMHHYFIELKLENNDFEKMLKDHLETPTWVFEFVQLEDWKKHAEVNIEHFFTNILTEVSGYDIFLNKSKYADLSSRFNLTKLLKSFISDLDVIIQQFINVEAFVVNIDSSPEYKSGYFAHDECNYGSSPKVVGKRENF